MRASDLPAVGQRRFCEASNSSRRVVDWHYGLHKRHRYLVASFRPPLSDRIASDEKQRSHVSGNSKAFETLAAGMSNPWLPLRWVFS
jgi:hypothetical protein